MILMTQSFRTMKGGQFYIMPHWQVNPRSYAIYCTMDIGRTCTTEVVLRQYIWLLLGAIRTPFGSCYRPMRTSTFSAAIKEHLYKQQCLVAIDQLS